MASLPERRRERYLGLLTASIGGGVHAVCGQEADCLHIISNTGRSVREDVRCMVTGMYVDGYHLGYDAAQESFEVRSRSMHVSYLLYSTTRHDNFCSD